MKHNSLKIQCTQRALGACSNLGCTDAAAHTRGAKRVRAPARVGATLINEDVAETHRRAGSERPVFRAIRGLFAERSSRTFEETIGRLKFRLAFRSDLRTSVSRTERGVHHERR